MVNVRAGGLTFFGGAGNDGFYIEGEGLQGLLSGVDVKRDRVSRPQAHGDFDVPGFLEARIVSLAGPCLADSAEKLSHYGRQLTGLLADGGSIPVTFDVPGGPLWGRARLAEKTQFDVTLWGSDARYSVRFLFANPRLFGESRTVSGLSSTPVVSHHFGNFAASPVLTVVGSMPSGYTVYGPGLSLFSVSAPVVLGVPHEIDLASGLLRVGGSVVYGAVSAARPWSIPGGVSVAQQLVPVSGSGTLSVTTVDTFI